jgi:hypothetical protein
LKTNYVLIDYENVQPSALKVLNQDHFKVIVFVGASQSKIAFDVAEALQSLGPRAEYVRITGNGSNALDFHIVFYIGQLAAHEPDAYFHIISKDGGFDPLIQHLKQRRILASRCHDIAAIPLVRATQATSQDEKLAVIIANLQLRSAAKLRTVATSHARSTRCFRTGFLSPDRGARPRALASGVYPG